MSLRSVVLALVAITSCNRSTPAEPPVSWPATPPTTAAATSPTSPTARAAPSDVPALPPTNVAAVARVVAIGDLHGDLSATRAALRLAGAIDSADHWSGGALAVVQTGDQLDRGDGERGILELLDRVAIEARAAGGALYALNGNHEIMNVQADFRYVTPGGYRDFGGVQERTAAFAPGGVFARKMAAHNTVMVVGDTAFVHGGLLPEHVAFGLERINRSVREYMLGVSRELPVTLRGEDSPVWHRAFAIDATPEQCVILQRALEAAHVTRLVVGHTVQSQGINAACDGRVWRIDVGLSSHYGGPLQVLELPRGGAPRVLTGARLAVDSAGELGERVERRDQVVEPRVGARALLR